MQSTMVKDMHNVPGMNVNNLYGLATTAIVESKQVVDNAQGTHKGRGEDTKDKVKDHDSIKPRTIAG